MSADAIVLQQHDPRSFVQQCAPVMALYNEYCVGFRKNVSDPHGQDHKVFFIILEREEHLKFCFIRVFAWSQENGVIINVKLCLINKSV